MLKRSLPMVYGLFSHLVFGVVFMLHLAFLLNIVLPRTVSIGETTSPLAALMIDVALIGLFGLQHSLMARPFFKRGIPEAYRRSSYILASSAMLALISLGWQPIPQPIWQVDGIVGRVVLYGMFFAGIGLVLLSIALMDYFQFFGLKQAFNTLRRQPVTEIAFRLPLLYRLIRHPLMLGLLLMYWSTPDMTAGHLALASGMSVYIAIGVRFEERDLVNNLGEDYAAYRRETPMLIPRIALVRRRDERRA